MLLSENFKNRMLKLAGIPVAQNLISEADKRNVITSKLKIPKEIADWAHNLSDKYSVWIADSLKRHLIDDVYVGIQEKDRNFVLKALSSPSFKGLNKNDFPEMSDSDFNRMNKGLNGFIKDLNGEYLHVLDWLKGRNTLAPEQDQINFKTLTLKDALKRSDEWHQKLKDIQGGKIEGEEGEVVMTFPEGFYWIKIGKDYCPKEAEAMGHCGRAAGTTLYSLRREQYPYVTAAVREEDGVVTQMKGRANTKPKAQFHKYIIPFILGNNPNVNHFKSTYGASTDFNIADLSDSELKQVINKKPSLLLGEGGIAISRLSETEIMHLLTSYPEIMKNLRKDFPLNAILKNKEMVDWAINHMPELFVDRGWGNIHLDKEQFINALKSDVISKSLHLDEMQIDSSTLNWIVHNKPEMLEKSQKAIKLLNNEQKDYLVLKHPMAFSSLISLYQSDSDVFNEVIINSLGLDRIQKIFVSNPIIFSKGNIPYGFFKKFLTPELLENYIKNHNPQDDPLDIFNNTRRLLDISQFMNINTAFYLIKHYPNHSYNSSILIFSNKKGGEIIGKYIIDHHLDWLESYRNASMMGYKFKIQDWNLSPAQKQKIVNSDIAGDTTILANYDENELRKLELSPKQVQQLLSSKEVQDDLTVDMILGFSLAPDKESTQNSIIQLLYNDEENSAKTLEKISEAYGEEYVRTLYNKDPEAFVDLKYPVIFHDVNRLKKYNNENISYEDKGIKLRFDDWNDDELSEFFDDPKQAKRISNYELDFYGYDYKFDDIDNDFDELNQINMARVKFLLGKAFPKEFKDKIKSMKPSELVDILNDPDSISEEPIEYNDSIIDGIKDAFVRAYEDAKRQADESEYWKLYTKPIEDLFGKPKWETIKVKKKGEDKITDKNVLEFEISYGQLAEWIDMAREGGDYFYNDEPIQISQYAKDIYTIIKAALDYNGHKLSIEEPYYGVSGDVKKEDLNEMFNERLYDHEDLNTLLDNAKIVVNRKKK